MSIRSSDIENIKSGKWNGSTRISENGDTKRIHLEEVSGVARMEKRSIQDEFELNNQETHCGYSLNINNQYRLIIQHFKAKCQKKV